MSLTAGNGFLVIRAEVRNYVIFLEYMGFVSVCVSGYV